MQRTVGNLDRIIRIVVGVLLLGVALRTSVGTVLEAVLIVLGVVALLTALTGVCPLYNLLGVNTCKVKRDG